MERKCPASGQMTYVLEDIELKAAWTGERFVGEERKEIYQEIVAETLQKTVEESVSSALQGKSAP